MTTVVRLAPAPAPVVRVSRVDELVIARVSRPAALVARIVGVEKAGPPGPPGPPGVAETFIHDQALPADVWTIAHNLGRYPSVTVVDSAGEVVVGDTVYVDANTVVVTFSGGFAGRAYLN